MNYVVRKRYLTRGYPRKMQQGTNIKTGRSRYSLMARPDPLLERLLVFMLCCFVCEVVLLVHVKELFPIADRKIVPLADSHTESTFFWIVHRIYKGLDREIALDCGTFSRAARSIDVDRVAVSVRSGYCETYLAPADCRIVNLFY